MTLRTATGTNRSWVPIFWLRQGGIRALSRAFSKLMSDSNKLPRFLANRGEDTKRNLKHAKRLARLHVPRCGAAGIDLDRG